MEISPVLGDRWLECFEKPTQPRICLSELPWTLGWHYTHRSQAMGCILQSFYMWKISFRFKVLWDQR